MRASHASVSGRWQRVMMAEGTEERIKVIGKVADGDRRALSGGELVKRVGRVNEGDEMANEC